MKTLFKAYPTLTGFNETKRTAIEVEFKFILQTIEQCHGVMATIAALEPIRGTFQGIYWQVTVFGLKVYSIKADGEMKELLLITDNL